MSYDVNVRKDILKKRITSPYFLPRILNGEKVQCHLQEHLINFDGEHSFTTMYHLCGFNSMVYWYGKI